jgi:hypothetical protein
MKTHAVTSLVASLAVLAVPAGAFAQAKGTQQVVKAPVAQLSIDLATHVMPGMPDMPALPGGMGGMFGGGASGSNSFGNSRSMSPGRYADISFVTQRKPAGSEATQTVPPASTLAPSVPLVPVTVEPPVERGATAGPRDGTYERPKGRLLLYWGCGENVRAGQPRVLDFSNPKPQEWENFMQGRAVRERGAVARPGHSIWPNDKDRRMLGRDASFAGDHALSGDGVPADLRFAIGSANDLMPAIGLAQQGAPADVVRLSWQPVTNARAYFINAMGAGADMEMVMWSSAELPDFGGGLMDYASPGNIEQWLKERVLLPTSTTECAIPKGIFAKSTGAMARMIAYGPELNLAHPPRPADVSKPWEPEWAVRVRTKSTAMVMLGMDMGGRAASRSAPAAAPAAAATTARARPDCPPPASASADSAAAAGAAAGGAVLGGGFGRSVGSAVGGLLGALGGSKPAEQPKDVPADCPQ